MTQTNNNHPLMLIKEVADEFRVDATTVRRWIKNGTLKSVELPGGGQRPAMRVRRKDVERILGLSEE